MISLTSLVVGPLALFSGYLAFLYIYNVYFHPLSRYPGPKPFAGFRFPYVYNQLSGRLPLRIKELHDIYGPVVRIAPNELTYTTATAWRDIFGFRPGHPQLPKDLSTLPPIPPDQPPDLIHGNDAVHSRYRKLLSHAFSSRALEEQHEMIMSYVNSLINGLRSNTAKPVDLVAWYNWTTFDLIGDLAFGEPFECLLNQRYHPWVNTILGGINGGVAISAAERYGLGGLLISMIPKSMTKQFDLMHDYNREKVARRLERGMERPDFMSHLMRNDKERKEMSQKEMETNALTIIVAGSETTATVLSGATFHLIKNPEVLRRVQEEVRKAFRSEKEIDCTSVNHFEYLDAVLKESLRIYPPAPSSIPRKVVLSEGDKINGRWVPQGTSVGLFQWACNHSASNWHDPEGFHPERWLPNPPPDFASDSKDAMQSFSLGPRNCIGKNLAWVEMRVVLAKMLFNFDFSLEGVSEGWLNQKCYLIWAKHPLMVKLTPAR